MANNELNGGFISAPLAMKSTEFIEGVDSPKSSLSLQAFSEGSKSTKEDVEEQQIELSGVVSFVKERFERAKTARQYDEQRWIHCYNNFRGVYGNDVQFLDSEKSRAFIKITKTKVLAAYSKITQILFAAKKFPIGVEPTPVTEGVVEDVYFDPKEAEIEKKGQATGGREFGSSSIVRPSIKKAIEGKLGPIQEVQDRLKETGNELKEGVGKTPTSHTWSPAAAAAKKADKLIQDQIEESNGSKHLNNTAHELCLFGAGIMKGPFAVDKEYPRWDDDGKYNPAIKTVPEISSVSVWNGYPDPDGRSMDDCEYFIERHRMNKTQLRELKRRPYFRAESIELAISTGPNYMEEHWETLINDGAINNAFGTERFEVLEYWGFIDKDIAEQADLELPEEYEDYDQLQVNIWICNNQILRLVLNPFKPQHIPYYIVPYEVNPYSIFGIGVAENMLDTQLIMNGFMRLAIDNAVLSSNIVFEVNETNLVPGQNMQLYPGKMFRTQGAPGQSIFAQKYPNVTQECMLLFDKARQLSDEATGIPSYAHGMSGVMSTGRTASGMSMLMEAAQENIKAVIRNIDEYLLIPLGQAMYAFNMQFNFNKEIKGDINIVARGTESLMRSEIRAQKLMQFLQMTNNEMDAPWVKRDYGLRELAKDLDLDADKLVNDAREAALQAETLKKYREAMGTMEQPMAGSGSQPNMGAPNSGGIGAGIAPNPGAEGFSGGTPPNLGTGGAAGGGGQPVG